MEVIDLTSEVTDLNKRYIIVHGSTRRNKPNTTAFEF